MQYQISSIFAFLFSLFFPHFLNTSSQKDYPALTLLAFIPRDYLRIHAFQFWSLLKHPRKIFDLKDMKAKISYSTLPMDLLVFTDLRHSQSINREIFTTLLFKIFIVFNYASNGQFHCIYYGSNSCQSVSLLCRQFIKWKGYTQSSLSFIFL